MNVSSLLSSGVNILKALWRGWGSYITQTKDVALTVESGICSVPLKVTYHDVQEHTGVKHSYPGISLDMPEVGVCSITMPLFITEVVKGV